MGTMQPLQASAGTILTFGHSTRSWEEGLELLRSAGVRTLVDVRTVPRSRHNPQWARENVEPALRAAGLDYVWQQDLGGLRHTTADSRNTGWHNASFRGFADYMGTDRFRAALEWLMAQSRGPAAPVCIMCAEAVPWRCHRSLIADALTAHGVPVAHIVGGGPPRPHRLTPFAVVRGHDVWYPAEAAGGPLAVGTRGAGEGPEAEGLAAGATARRPPPPLSGAEG